MREQIGRLKTIRTLRAEQRKREYQSARAQYVALDSRLNAQRQEFVETRTAMEQCKAPPSPGETVTNADLERRAQLARQYNQYLGKLKQQIVNVMKERDQQQKVVSAAKAEMRKADKAVDQLDTIDEKLAEEEARLAEIQEELQAENLAKPRWSI